MSAVLEIALIAASIAIVALVSCLGLLLYLAWRQLKQLVLAAQNMKVVLDSLIVDGRDLVSNVKLLSERANQHLQNVDNVVHTVQQWTKRADRIVNELGTAIEPPLFSFVQNANLLRMGVTTFFQQLLHHPPEIQVNNTTRKEIDNV